MAVTVAQLAGYLGTSPDEPTLPAILSTAQDMVDGYLGTDGVTACPLSVYDTAVEQLGSELFARRNSPSGIAQWTPDGQPVRLARDPMTSVKPLLLPYRPLGTVG